MYAPTASASTRFLSSPEEPVLTTGSYEGLDHVPVWFAEAPVKDFDDETGAPFMRVLERSGQTKKQAKMRLLFAIEAIVFAPNRLRIRQEAEEALKDTAVVSAGLEGVGDKVEENRVEGDQVETEKMAVE
ncbi:hypothetical protein JCM3766R1_000969 [Sporobolomyces carnicolor]